MGRGECYRWGMEAFSCVLQRLGGGRNADSTSLWSGHIWHLCITVQPTPQSISHAACKHHLKNSQARCLDHSKSMSWWEPQIPWQQWINASPKSLVHYFTQVSPFNILTLSLQHAWLIWTTFSSTLNLWSTFFSCLKFKVDPISEFYEWDTFLSKVW